MKMLLRNFLPLLALLQRTLSCQTTPQARVYTPPPASKGCNSVTSVKINSITGTVESHIRFDKRTRYQANSWCRWRLIAPLGTNILIQFTHLDVPCGDYVAIYDGPSSRHQLIGKFCGDQLPNEIFSSTSEELLIQFRTDAIVQATGFQLKYDRGVCGQPNILPIENSRILGGFIARPHSFPWQVQLRYSSNAHKCGGSLVGPQWIITAAHCVDNYRTVLSGTIRLGAHGRTSNEGTVIPMSRTTVILHADYMNGWGSSDYDYAMIKLQEPVAYTANIKPICLPTSSIQTGSKCIVVGWGRKEEGALAESLRQVTLPIFDWNQCVAAHGRDSITSRMICAGYSGGMHAPCAGDSGSGLACAVHGSYVLYGAVSWGPSCGSPRGPEVFADIHTGLNWFKSVMQKTSIWTPGTVWTMDSLGKASKRV